MTDPRANSPSPMNLPVLDYLQRMIDGTLQPEHRTSARYPTAISRTLGFRLVRPLKVPSAEQIYKYWNSGVQDEP